jgi:hypothetical protein
MFTFLATTTKHDEALSVLERSVPWHDLTRRCSQPDAQALPFAHSTLNPYLSIMLTFLVTTTKHDEALPVLERSIPWHDLTHLLSHQYTSSLTYNALPPGPLPPPHSAHIVCPRCGSFDALIRTPGPHNSMYCCACIPSCGHHLCRLISSP